MKLFTVCLALLAIALRVHSQDTVRRLSIGDCPRPDVNTVEGVNTIESLIPLAFDTADGAPVPMIADVTLNVVCEAPGLLRDTISSFSVVAQFSCTGRAGCDGTPRIEQFQFECNSDNTFSRAEISAGLTRTDNPTGTLETPLNTGCAQCVLSSLFGSDVGADDHCVACLQGCTEGQMRCVGPDNANQCCNWYLNNRCVVTCPGNLVGDTEPDTMYDCGCGPLQLDNGEISYSNRFAVNSVATHTCDRDRGYLLEGNSNQRTCDETVEGWTGTDITCMLKDCGSAGIVKPDNGDVDISTIPTTFGNVVTYSCNSGYKLEGDSQRTCTIDGWDGDNPTCVEGPTVASSGATDANTGSPCGTACIIGIVLAILAAIILTAVLVGVGYAIYSYMNNPDTKLAKLDPNGINGVARDNPLYVDPDAVVGAEATDAVVGAEAA